MATLTKAELADRVLENLGVKPSGQAASAEDSVLTEEAIDAVHAQLRKSGHAPFELATIPEWAQTPLRDIVSAELAGSFGIAGYRLQVVIAAMSRAERQLAKQTSTGPQQTPIRPYWF